MPGLISSARELTRLLDDVADIDWRHPAWWGLVGGTAVLERLACPARADTPDTDLYATYLSANGGPRSDTFMARPRRISAALSPVMTAIVRARAALAALAKFDGQFPGQPLHRALTWRDGWLDRTPAPPRVAFVTPRGIALADLPSDAEIPSVAKALAAFMEDDNRGAPPRAPLLARDPNTPTAAPVAVTLGPVPLPTARHLHRRAWTESGGPWLGIGETDDLELVTTCHLGVDGYGHGLISTAIFDAIDRTTPDHADAPTATAIPHHAVSTFAPFPDAEPLGVAHAVLPAADGAFSRAAYAIGRAVERIFRADTPDPVRRAAHHSPTFQIPLAPGGRADDQDRRRRRVLFALLALRMQDGDFEPYPEFRARLEQFLVRERAATGLLTRILAATSRAPLPPAAKRFLLVSNGETHRLVPPIEVLGGRASLSSLRYPAGERSSPPLLAASSPAIRDSVVLTLVHHDESCTATVCGTGRAATDDGARAFLDAWRSELAATP